jgi:predicted transcriptional regulator
VSTLIKNQVLTFRVDEATKHRILRCLGWRYRSRTVFIRSAIEQLLVAEEASRP